MSESISHPHLTSTVPHFAPAPEPVQPELPVGTVVTGKSVGRAAKPTVTLPPARLVTFPTIYKGEATDAQFKLEWHSVTSPKTKTTRLFAVPEKPANFADLETYAAVVGEERFVDAVWRALLIPAGKQASLAIGDAPFTDTTYLGNFADELDYSRSSVSKKADLLEDHLKLSSEQNEIMQKMSEHFANGTPLPTELRARAAQIALRITEILTAIEAINNKPKKKKAAEPAAAEPAK